jgi:cytochrome b pre-mRNA-processing protein 3
MAEGDEGRLVRNSMLQAMWEDVDVRSKKLEGALSSARKHQIGELNEMFQANMIGYDEGLLTDDRVLAGK